MENFPARMTSRLIIREITPDDGPEIYKYMSDPQVTAWLPEGLLSASGAQDFAEEHAGEGSEALALIDRASGDFVGHMVFHAWAGTHTYEIGWVIAQPFQRQGLATEAARSLLGYAFETLQCHRVIATCQPENTASWKVMEALGMRREGLYLKCIDRGVDGWWDEYVYAILEEEYSSNGS
jgi:ribosomal-protein-alanine N-acetyltransferase